MCLKVVSVLIAIVMNFVLYLKTAAMILLTSVQVKKTKYYLVMFNCIFSFSNNNIKDPSCKSLHVVLLHF